MIGMAATLSNNPVAENSPPVLVHSFQPALATTQKANAKSKAPPMRDASFSALLAKVSP